MAPRPSNLFNAETLLGLYRVADYGNYAAAIQQATADGGGVVLLTGLQDFDPATSTPANISVLDAGTIALHQQMMTARDMWDAIYAGYTYTKPLLALRFDDGPASDYTTTYPQLKSRSLPGGFAIVQNWLGTTGYMTLANAQEIGQYHEIMCHSANHGVDPTTGDLITQFQGETTVPQAWLIAQNLYADSFVQPGTWIGAWNFNTEAQVELSYFGRYLKANFWAFEGYRPVDGVSAQYGVPLPRKYRYGVDHIEGNPLNYASLQTVINQLIGLPGGGVEIMFHSFNFDQPNNITTADFESFLTYIQTQRDAGLLDVVTPSGLLAAKPAIAGSKYNLIPDPSANAQPGGNVWNQGWTVQQGTPTLVAAGGQSGNNAVQVDYTDWIGVYLKADSLRVVRVEAYAKCATSGQTANARLILRPTGGGSNIYSNTYIQNVSNTGWTKIVGYAAMKPNCTALQILLYVQSSSDQPVLWTGLAAYKA